MPIRRKRQTNGGRSEPAAPNPASIERQVDEIAKLNLPSLRQRWANAHGRPPPPGLYRDLMVRSLAYRLQAAVFGDLDDQAKRFLAKVAKEGKAAFDEDKPPLKPGTVLVREWDRKLQRVIVLEQGFDWNGQRYASLSAVARAITGTNWNGFTFFGLRPRRSTRGHRDA